MRKIHYIDASKMSERELCKVLNIEYIPWYRSLFFWALCLLFSMPSLLMLIKLLG